METPGSRLQVVGPSCSGKSTLAERLAGLLGFSFVELDALFWKPGWVEPEAGEFIQKVLAATAGESWVVAGNYLGRTGPAIWQRLDTIIWLDFPLRTTIPRVVGRSWRRSHRRELLWGTNTERFRGQLKLWSPKESLIAHNVSSRKRMRERLEAAMREPKLAHIRWVRLRSPREVERWIAELKSEGAASSIASG